MRVEDHREYKVWAITWRYSDGSACGVLNNMVYKDMTAAQHICDTLRENDHSKQYTCVELGVVQGELK